MKLRIANKVIDRVLDERHRAGTQIAANKRGCRSDYRNARHARRAVRHGAVRERCYQPFWNTLVYNNDGRRTK